MVGISLSIEPLYNKYLRFFTSHHLKDCLSQKILTRKVPNNTVAQIRFLRALHLMKYR